MARTCDLSGTGRMTGNNVSKSNRKTRRTFLPNLSTFSFVSEALGKKLNLRITKRTYRTIQKHGSIDAFLQNVKNTKLTCIAKCMKKKVISKIGPSAKVAQKITKA